MLLNCLPAAPAVSLADNAVPFPNSEATPETGFVPANSVQLITATNYHTRHTGSTAPESGKCRFSPYSTVTDFARFRGWSTSVPFITAT